MKAIVIVLMIIATVTTVAIVKTQNNVRSIQQKLEKQVQDLKTTQETKIQSAGQQIDTLKQSQTEKDKQIDDLNTKLQSRLEAKKAEVVLASAKVAQVAPIAPTAVNDNYALVTKWANYYGLEPAWLHRVVKCESGYRSNAVNGTYWAQGSTPSGISQFLATTYIANAARIGLPAQDDRFNPDRALHVMAWMFSIGQWTQWECR